jgi:hypothetical protein
MGKKFNGITLRDWFESLSLNALPFEVWEKHTLEELAWLVLNYWFNSQPRSWGWSWGSWVSWKFDGNEFYDELSHDEKKKLDKALLEYIEKLAKKINEEKEIELKEELKKLIYR